MDKKITPLAHDDIAEEIRAWKRQLGDGPSVRVQCSRESPKEWNGRNVSGTLCIYDELPTEEMLQEDHGGGYFRLVCKRLDDSGRFVYAPGGHAMVRIAGTPNITAQMSLVTNKQQRNALRDEIRAIVKEELKRRPTET